MDTGKCLHYNSGTVISMSISARPPYVSILLPVYNGREFLDQALKSLVNQTWTDFELLAIDDGSTDDSLPLLERWAAQDKRIRVIRNSEPHGLPHALNRGLREAQGQYIARADQDDIHRPERLAKEIAWLEAHSKIMIIGTAYQPFSSHDKRSPLKHPSASPMIAWKMLSASAFCHPSVMFRRSVYQELDGYPVTGAEDFAYFSKIVRRWPATNLSEVFIDYREHATNYSITKKEAITKSIVETFQENMQHYLGSNERASIFYDFLVRRHLPLRHLLRVKITSLRIARKISTTYSIFPLAPSMLALYCHIGKELMIVSIRTWLRLPALGQPLRS